MFYFKFINKIFYKIIFNFLQVNAFQDFIQQLKILKYILKQNNFFLLYS